MSERKYKFTPGLWDVVDTREEDDVDTDYEVVDECEWIVAVPGNDHLFIEEANAYLIATAPEMYALLERINDMLILDEEDELKYEINSLLAKARGEVQDA